MEKLIKIFSLICLILSVLVVNLFSAEFCMANDLYENELYANELYENDLGVNNLRVDNLGTNNLRVKNLPSDVPVEEQNVVQNTQDTQFFMTDAKHKRFKKENRDYALVDIMLNFTWNAIKKQSSKEEFSKILKEQRLWLGQKRDAVANSFSLHLSEMNAFTLAIVARTQELANQIVSEAKKGRYFYVQKNIPQSAYIEVHTEGASLFIQGQNFSKNGRKCEIEGRGAAFSKGWTSLTTSENDKFFLLFTRDIVYVVHDIIGVCGKDVSFQGMYRMKSH